MNNLARFDHDGLELVIDSNTGACFASQSAIARMTGVADTTIMRWASSAGISPTKAEILTDKGFRSSALYDEDAIYQAFAKYRPELLIQCAKAGIRVYLHRLAGFDFVPTLPQPTETKNNFELGCHAIDLILKDVQVDGNVKAQLKHGLAEKYLPELKDGLEPVRRMLVSATAKESPWLTPTELGNKVGLSAVKINKLLIEKGFQIKNENRKSRKEPTYFLTEKGLRYGKFILSTGKQGDPNIFQQLRWTEAVLTEF